MNGFKVTDICIFCMHHKNTSVKRSKNVPTIQLITGRSICISYCNSNSLHSLLAFISFLESTSYNYRAWGLGCDEAGNHTII